MNRHSTHTQWPAHKRDCAPKTHIAYLAFLFFVCFVSFNFTMKCVDDGNREIMCRRLNRFTCSVAASKEIKVKRHGKKKDKPRIEFLFLLLLSFFFSFVCVYYCRLHNINLPHLIKNLIRSYCSNVLNMLSDDVRILFWFWEFPRSFFSSAYVFFCCNLQKQMRIF